MALQPRVLRCGRRWLSARPTAGQFDYVIVGAGSAGCVLANRLSSDPSNSVLLIEAGGEHNALTSPYDALSLKMPAMCLNNINGTRHNWAFQGEPEPELGGRQLKHDRGKVLGGSSSINGMVFIRGHPQDFEGWTRAGCDGWDYQEVLPYFKRMETYDGGGDEFRGDSGPLHVHRPSPTNPLDVAFLKAGAEAGYPLTDDKNGAQQEGFGVFDRTVHAGERWSTARAYLDPARNRPNLTVASNALVERVVLNGGCATGVVYRDGGGRRLSASAEHEVILSAGAVGTPHLLMLSGIGARSHLEAHDIECHADLQGVGANLNDHPDFVMKFRCPQPVTLYPQTKPLQSVLAGAQWLLTREGICSSNHFDVVACVKSSPEVPYPDLQLTISPIAMEDLSFEPMQEHAFQMHVGLMKVYSRGSIELRDADPASPPRILVNYLQDERDRAAMRRGIRMIRALVAQPAFAPLCGEEIFPGADAESDEALDAHLRTHCASQWHLTSTARMGRVTDPEAVVDSNGQVHGVGRLRVVDASIMPEVTNGNTNSPTIMLAEKLSDAILGREIWAPIVADVAQPKARAEPELVPVAARPKVRKWLHTIQYA